MIRYIIQWRINDQADWRDCGGWYDDSTEAEREAAQMTAITGDPTRIIKETTIRELSDGTLVD